MAISLQAEGVCAAHVVRRQEAQPLVERVASLPADASPVLQSLERLAKELHLGSCRCTTLLANGEYQLLSVDAPNVQADELKAALRWRIKDMIDFHVDDATIDVLDVPVDKSAATRSHSMYAVVARNQLIRQRQELMADARIPLTVIDIPEMAQRNISVLLEQEGRGIAFLSFDAAGGLLTVTYAGELYLSRRIDVPMSQLLQTDSEQRTACYDRITLELQRSLDHFDRQYHFITIARLVLGPMGDAGSGLQGYLSSNLYVPVESFDLAAVLDIGRVPELNDAQAQRRYFMTLGCALRHEEVAL